MQPTPPPPPNTVHQTLTDEMFAKTICRRCDGMYESAIHDFAECERHQIDAAMLADKRNSGRAQSSLVAGIKYQINDKTGEFA